MRLLLTACYCLPACACRLEVDLLMGTWATKHLPGMPLEQLKEYERILNRETIDIYNYITAKEAPPAELQGPVMTSLQQHVASSPLGKANPEVGGGFVVYIYGVKAEVNKLMYGVVVATMADAIRPVTCATTFQMPSHHLQAYAKVKSQFSN